MILYTILYNLFPITLSYTIKPLPVIFIAYITKHLLLTEDKYIPIFPNFVFNNRFLILILLISSLIFNMTEFKLEYFMSLYFGFLLCKFSNCFNYLANNEDILHFEKNENFKFFFSINGWIHVEECYFKSNIYGESIPESNSIKKSSELLDNMENLDNHIDINDSNLFIKSEGNFQNEQSDDLVLDLS
jgi:hypothetical protein